MIKKIIIKFNYFFEIISLQKNQKKLKKVNIFLSIICFLFIIDSYFQINEKINVQIKVTVTEVLLTTLSYFCVAVLWSKYMKLNYDGEFQDYFYNWSISKVGKFVPTGIMTLTIRLNQKIKDSKSYKQIFTGTLEEQVLFPLVSIPAIIISIRQDSKINKLFVVLFTLIVSFIIIKAIYTKFKSNKYSLINFQFLFILHLYFQFLVLYIIANRFDYEHPAEVALFYFLASSIGLFFIGVPSGLGIREYIFLISVGSELNFENLFGYMFTIRILFFATDLLFGLIGFVGKFLKGKNDYKQ